MKSLPVRECGLKFEQSNMYLGDNVSLPVRECGLKYQLEVSKGYERKVTPCAGVWIEIILISPCIYTVLVTPCAGVWIEIIHFKQV